MSDPVRSTWEMRRIAEVCKLISSGGTPSRKHPEYYTNGHHLWVKSQELRDGRIYDTEEKITDLGLAKSSAKEYPPDTILMAMYGATVGQLAILKRTATVNQAICAMVVDPMVADHRFLYYSLIYGRDKLTAKAHGAAQQNLNQGLIRDFAIPIPPLPVQRSIADILSAYDDLIENNTRRIAILEEMAQAIYREWFVHFRFPGHEQVEMVESELGPIPAGWEVVRLGDIAQEVRRSVDPATIDPETPYFGLEHLPRKSIALSDWGRAREVQSTKLRFRKGDILFGKIRPYFHKVGIAPVDGICSTDTIVIVPKSDKYRMFVLSYVSSEAFVAHATQTAQGTKMPRADWKVLVQHPVVVPPDELLARFENLCSDIVRLIQNLILRNRNLRQTRDLLLPKLISGEIEVEALESEAVGAVA